MNDICNWSPLAAIKLFTNRKRNTVEWLKMHNLQNGIYKFVRGINPRISILVSRRFALRPPLVVNRNLCYYSTWDSCVGKLHVASPKEWSRGDERIHPTYLKKTKSTVSTFKCIAKIHALESKPILLKTIFSLF